MRLNLDFSRFAAQIKRMGMTPEIRLHAHALKPKIFFYLNIKTDGWLRVF